MANNNQIEELKTILKVCQKVPFSNADNAKTVLSLMQKNGFSGTLSLRLMDRLRALSDPSKDQETNKCICCNSAVADVNKVFCKNCYVVMTRKIAGQPNIANLKRNVTAPQVGTTNNALKPVNDNLDSARTADNSKGFDGTFEEKSSVGDSTLDEESNDAEEYWDPNNSIVYKLSSAISPVFIKQVGDESIEEAVPKNNEIDYLDGSTISGISTGTQKPKKKHIVRNIILCFVGLYAILFIWYFVDTHIVHPKKTESSDLVDQQADVGHNDEASRQNKITVDQSVHTISDEYDDTDYSQYNAETINTYDDGSDSHHYDDSMNSYNDKTYGYPGDIEQEQKAYSGVDFSRYYVTEEQLITAYKNHADSVLQHTDGSATYITFANREYDTKSDMIIHDIYDSRNRSSLGQMGIRNDEDGGIKGVWIMFYNYALPRVLYEIIQPDMSEAEMNDFMAQTARDDGRWYFYLDGSMYYCISYISQDDLYITVVTRDEEYVRERTGDSTK